MLKLHLPESDNSIHEAVIMIGYFDHASRDWVTIGVPFDVANRVELHQMLARPRRRPQFDARISRTHVVSQIIVCPR
jgi:hypothetical protein